MPKYADADLTKVTLNLYSTDVQWFKRLFDHDYTVEIRNALHEHVRRKNERAKHFDELRSPFPDEEGE